MDPVSCTNTHLFIYLFILFVLYLLLRITEQTLFAIKNSNKMLIYVNTLVKKPIEHRIFYEEKKNSPTKFLIYNITVK